MARPMSPLTFSFPAMNNICPDCLPDSMSSQSWPATWSVRFGLVAGPGFTVQVPSLITACQVPPPSPLTSYWIVAVEPAALSGRKRPLIASKVSFTVGIVPPPSSEGEKIHPARDGQHGARDVPGALGAKKRERVGDILRLAFLLHRHPLDHPVVERRQGGVGRNDAGRHRIARDVVARSLERHRLREAHHAELGRGVGRLAEAAHEAGDRGHAHDATPAALAHAREHRPRDLERPRQVDREVELPVLVAHVLQLTDGVDHAGVVHADVDGPEIALDARDHILHPRAVADVALIAAHRPPPVGDLLGRRLSALGVQVDDRDLAALGRQDLRIRLADASRSAGDQGDLPADAEIHYRPLNCGSRLAKNAWIPSAASSLRSVGRNCSSSMSIDLAIGASSPSSTALMMAAVASGARLPSWRASALASFSVSPSFDSRFTRPSARHSGAGTWVPSSRNSSAFVRPISRGSRCVPP